MWEFLLTKRSFRDRFIYRTAPYIHKTGLRQRRKSAMKSRNMRKKAVLTKKSDAFSLRQHNRRTSTSDPFLSPHGRGHFFAKKRPCPLRQKRRDDDGYATGGSATKKTTVARRFFIAVCVIIRVRTRPYRAGNTRPSALSADRAIRALLSCRDRAPLSRPSSVSWTVCAR